MKAKTLSTVIAITIILCALTVSATYCLKTLYFDRRQPQSLAEQEFGDEFHDACEILDIVQDSMANAVNYKQQKAGVASSNDENGNIHLTKPGLDGQAIIQEGNKVYCKFNLGEDYLFVCHIDADDDTLTTDVEVHGEHVKVEGTLEITGEDITTDEFAKVLMVRLADYVENRTATETEETEPNEQTTEPTAAEVAITGKPSLL